MANMYDPLMNYLAKNGECPHQVAMQLLNKYSSDTARHNQINRLVRAKKIKRDYRSDGTYYKLLITPVKFIPKGETPAEQDTTLDAIAQIYRFMVRYGAQHYAVPGRANIAAVARLWLDQRRDMIQFLNLLVELIDNQDISHLEYRELEAGLKESGWYVRDYDAYDVISQFRFLVNPGVDVDGENISLDSGLGLTKEDWDSLKDPNSLRRINSQEPESN